MSYRWSSQTFQLFAKGLTGRWLELFVCTQQVWPGSLYQN